MLEGLFILFTLLLAVTTGVVLVGKTGLNGWLGLLAAVPGANILLVLYLASSTWPVRRELAVRRLQAGEGDMDDGWIAYREAVRLQKTGAAQKASSLFQLLEARFPGSPLASDARISRANVRLHPADQASHAS